LLDIRDKAVLVLASSQILNRLGLSFHFNPSLRP
jgi:hypothetical protein